MERRRQAELPRHALQLIEMDARLGSDQAVVFDDAGHRRLRVVPIIGPAARLLREVLPVGSTGRHAAVVQEGVGVDVDMRTTA